MRDPERAEPPIVRVYRGFDPLRQIRPPDGLSRSAPWISAPGIAFVLVWFSALVTLGIAFLSDRGAAEASLRATPEHRCLARASQRKPFIRWARFRLSNNDETIAFAGTMREPPGLDCIPDGGAVTYLHLPSPPAGELALFRLPGETVRAEPRGSEWSDLVEEGGAGRYRNDGHGYIKVAP